MMKKMMCLAVALVMMMCFAVGCSEAPAKTVDDGGAADSVDTTTTAPLTANEQALFEAMDGVSDLSLGMKNTDQSAVRCAVALLDWCEQSNSSDEELQAAARKYYDTYGPSFKMMFAEKMRLTAEACEMLRDEAVRGEKMSAAGATTEIAWTDKAFDTVAVIAAVIAE